MRHEERVEELKRMYRAMLERLERSHPDRLPSDVDIKKLESSYEELKGYAFVLKKIE